MLTCCVAVEQINRRKLEHVQHILEDTGCDRGRRDFEQIALRHRALPELDLNEVDSSLSFLGRKLRFPLLISSMTGGDDERLITANRNLALAAEHCGVALAVGSQRVQFKQDAARASFDLRPLAPNALLLANLGAVQLNLGFGTTEAQEALSTLDADGLFLHLNPLQEAIQPEGDVDFSGLADRIGQLNEELNSPILIKEIGCGLSRMDAELLFARGLRFFDVAGRGGTSWSRIEHHRRQPLIDDDLGLLFQDWGLPTPRALMELAPLRERGATLIASGGIRDALDMLKSVILGASLVGMAKPFLEPALESAEAVIARIESLERAFRIGMFLLGCRTLHDLHGNEDLLLDPPELR